MDNNQEYQISIIGVEEIPGSKSLMENAKNHMLSKCKVSSQILSENLKTFCAAVTESLTDIDLPASDFELSEFEVSVDISIQGEISLIGSLEAGAGSGIKMTFKKKGN
ncbi:Pepco domain-containing protein [Hungatella effluvii]|uniref:Pepco domain-containing protein n=1 Tax=Hungatella effluvii TaxID=1096246 RepID=UPI0022E3CB25|nr:hypothetical protein [Hungatella effluvii]